MQEVGQINALPNIGIMQFAPRDSVSAAQQHMQSQPTQPTQMSYAPSSYQTHTDQQQQQQQQRQGNMLPPIPQASPGIPSFSLSGASLVSGVNSSSNTAGTTDIGDFQFNRSLVTPTTPTNNFSDNCGQSPSAAYAFTPSSSPMSASQYHQQHQSMRLVSLPISQSYSHQPTTQHSQSTGMLLNGQPITPISSTQAAQSATHGRPPRNKSKFKRFRNAFIYFVNDQRTKVDDETKRLKNREFLQLMSARWKSMSEEDRRPYVRLAEEDKKRFNEDVKKFGKYESRQRRYNKSRSFDAGLPGHHPYNLANSRPSNANAAAAGFLYSGYGRLASNQAAALSGPLPPFYAGLTASPSGTAAAVAAAAAAAAAAGWSADTRRSSMVSASTAGVRQQQPLLNPPEALCHRNSFSSNASSADLNDIQASFNPAYAWPSAAAATPQGAAPSGGLQPQVAHQGYYAAAGYQQPSANNIHMPTGAPIAHSLTEPMFYEGAPRQQCSPTSSHQRQQPLQYQPTAAQPQSRFM